MLSEVQSLSIDAEIELFELSNYNPDSPGDVFRFTNHIGVIFGGVSYNPIPCELEGISYTSEGSLPRPKIRISDAGGYISALINGYGGIEGSTITIRRTLRKFLDGESTANSFAEKPRDVFIVSQKTQEVPGRIVEFELSAAIDFIDEQLPGRYALQRCSAVYRNVDTGCTYAGSRYFDINNKATLDPKKDVCSKSIDGCEKRFGKKVGLPFMGFPGLQRS